jgi:flagellar hook-associated protein 1 FlgK
MSLTQALNSAISGLNTAQSRISITSSNIANVNTAGYSRKIAGQESITLNGQGAGVQIGDVTRNVNAGLQSELRGELGKAGTAEVRDEFYQRVQVLFGTPQSNSAISQRISDLSDAFEQLNSTPEQNSPKVQVLAAATQLVDSFGKLSDQIQTLRSDADDSINQEINDANSLLSQIAKLNTDIVRLGNIDQPTTELRDQRDQKVNALSKIINTSTYTREDGSMVIFTANGSRPLLDRSPVTLNFSPTAGYEPGSSGSGISLDGVDITDEIKSGTLRGLVDMRDQDLPQLADQINELATQLRDAINAEHNKGSAFPPPTNLTGSRQIEGTDPLAATGTFRVAALGTNGDIVSYSDIDLSTLPSPATVADLVTAINSSSSGGDLQARIADGRLVIEGKNGNRVAVNELDSAVTLSDGRSQGLSHYFGLNDLFTTAKNSRILTSTAMPDASSALGVSGTLTLSAGSGTLATPISVSYTNGDNLTTIQNKLRGQLTGALGLSADQASNMVYIANDGDRARLVISSDANMFATDTGNLSSKIGLTEDQPDMTGSLTVSQEIVNDPSRLSRGTLNADVYQSGSASGSGIKIADPAATLPGLGTPASPPAPAGTNYTLSITGSFGTVPISYNGSTDSLNSLAARINADSTLTDNNINAEVYFDGSAGSYKIRIQDAGGESFYISDNFASMPSVGGTDTSLVETLGLGIPYGLREGDNSSAASLAGALSRTDINFDAAGGLSPEKTSLIDYAASIISTASTKAATASDANEFQNTLANDLDTRIQNEAGVNLDEEMSDLIIFQRAYSASAKVISTVDELFDTLLNAV